MEVATLAAAAVDSLAEAVDSQVAEVVVADSLAEAAAVVAAVDGDKFIVQT